MVRALLWSHCFISVPVFGRTWTTYVRLPEFGPKSVRTHGQPRQSPTECIFLLELKHKSLRNNFGNQSERDTVSSPLLGLKRNILNTNLNDKSGYCACAVTAFQRNLNGIFFYFITYLNTYLQNSGFSLLGEKKGIKNTLYINMYDM